MKVCCNRLSRFELRKFPGRKNCKIKPKQKYESKCLQQSLCFSKAFANQNCALYEDNLLAYTRNMFAGKRPNLLATGVGFGAKPFIGNSSGKGKNANRTRCYL